MHFLKKAPLCILIAQTVWKPTECLRGYFGPAGGSGAGGMGGGGGRGAG